MTGGPARPTRSPERARARRARRAASAACAAVLVPLLAGVLLPVSTAMAGVRAKPPVPPAQKPVPVHAVRGRRVSVPAMTPYRRPAVRWPAAGSAAVTLPAAGTAGTAGPAAGTAGSRPRAGHGPDAVQAGKLPVWVGRSAAGQAARVAVTMAPHQAAAAAGVHGVIFTMRRSGPAAAPARVHVSLSYAGFAAAYGGGYASRLRLVELPGCALTTPGVPSCRVQTPLPSATDPRTAQIGAQVTLPPAPAAGLAAARAPAASGQVTTAAYVTAAAAPAAVVLAATSTTSGSGGNYTATPLSEAGTWSAGGSSGAFTYSYPIQVPPVPGGLAPTVSLGYNSQAVDGLTSSTTNQASWIGDGWSYSPGFISRSYKPCSQTSAKTGDLCWSSSDTVTMSLGGATTTLVKDDSTGAWHAEADNGYQVQYLTGTGNGTHDGDYWKVTDPGGTSYYFGLTLPGYQSGSTTPANAAWNVPVYATQSGQPCYNATFANSHCMQAWRWQLDYVTDTHGDAMAYLYKKETNHYAADNGTTATAGYNQAGALSQIWYGLRAGQVYGVTPAAEVQFATSTSRTDVPTDLSCASGASCAVQSPTFWGKYELTGITTEALSGQNLASVDSWSLGHSYPSTGDPSSPPALWLDSITRTGEDGTSVSLPPVTFTGTALPNRVETQTDINDGYSIITRFRITEIQNETGGLTTVNYLAPSGACTGSGSFPAPDANTLLCYPDYWTPSGVSSPVLDWFNKYVVNSVTEQDPTGNAVPVQTAYSYSGAAWHYDDDSLTRSQNRTWDQWRGFRTVTTQTGTSPDPVTKAVDTYFQGMNGDYQSGGGTSSVSLTSGHGDTVTDSPQFAGEDFEHVVYDGAGGGKVTDTVTIPWTSAATATQSQPSPLPALTAHMTGTGETDTYTSLASGGTRESREIYSHDSYGRVTSVSDIPDTGSAAEDTCTTTSYATNTSEWLLDLPAEKKVVSVPCTATASLPADAVSDEITLYDGATSAGSDTPAAGDVTQTELATSYSGSTPQYTTESKATYDEYGRVLTSTNADGKTTTTAYTPGTGAEPTSKTVTDPMGLGTTTTYDPARDLPLTVTSPAGLVTTEQYDALGRLTAVWTPGNSTSGSADYTFGYAVSATAPSVVTTSTLEPGGSYLAGKTLYDALGRVRETQTETADGNRDVTDTIYNSDGWKSLVSNSYYATGAPSGTLVAAQDSQVPSQTGYVYDGAGRVTKKIAYALATQTWETDTTYGGDYTTVVPPSGGTAQTTFTDGRGLTTAVYQYHSGAPADPSDPASDYDKTSYAYTPARQLAAITDAAGNNWSYGYDLAGNRTSATTPDTGASASTYDAAGQLLTATDAAGKQVSYAYNDDGQKTAEYDTTGGVAASSSDELASWSYDTAGRPSSATSYYGGAAFTTQVIGYNAYGLSEGTETIIPSTSLTGALSGTYVQEFTYEPTGQVKDYVDGKAGGTEGGLPTETVSYGYDNAGRPTGVGGSWSYVSNLSYTELGQPQEYAFGTTSTPAWLVDSYDQQTGRLTEAATVTGTSAVTVDDQHYSYDNAGLVTSEADTPSGGPAQVQCYSYDYLGRLVQAWSQVSAGCASSPSQSAEGGAAPYWNQYTYNSVNDLTKVVSTPPSGSATTTTSSFPAAGSARPHAVSSQSVSGPSGTATTTFGYDAAGRATSVTSASGTQSLSWNATGKVASAGGTSYVYDAGGNLLLRADAGSVTLFLPDAQVSEDSSGAVSGVRYYSLGGVTVAARDGSGNVSYLIGDRNGTATLAVDSQTLAVTRRYYGPYGNPVGTPPSSWPGDRGFVGGTADSSTGLVNLGAREYDPGAGAFISPDPVLKPHLPADLNPYAYAFDSPVTSSDPSGLLACSGSACCPSSGCYGAALAQAMLTYSAPAYSRGRTDPVPSLGPSYQSQMAVYLTAPAPPPVIRTTRTVHPHQASDGSGAVGTSCGRPRPFCQRARAHRLHPGHGSFSILDWAGHHWKMIAVIGGTVLAAGLCAGTVIGCATLLAGAMDVSEGSVALGLSAALGAGSGLASYAVSPGRKSGAGWVKAGFFGAAVGLAGGGADALVIRADGGIAARTFMQFSARASANSVIGMYNAAWTPQNDQNPGYLLENAQMAGDRAFGVPAGALLGSLKLFLMTSR